MKLIQDKSDEVPRSWMTNQARSKLARPTLCRM